MTNMESLVLKSPTKVDEVLGNWYHILAYFINRLSLVLFTQKPRVYIIEIIIARLIIEQSDQPFLPEIPDGKSKCEYQNPSISRVMRMNK